MSGTHFTTRAAFARRLARLLLSLPLVVAAVSTARAQLFTPTDAAWLSKRLGEPRQGAPTAALLGDFAPVVQRREKVDLGAFAVPSFDTVSCVLDRAVERGVSVAQLFADEVFLADGPLAIALGPETLRRIDTQFDLHSLFPLSVSDGDHRPLRMTFFVVGRGHLFIGYDRNTTASPPDGAYHIFSGNYEYRRFIRMDTARDGTGRRLSGIATLSSPAAPFESFIGPGNAAIVSMSIRGTVGTVQAKLAFTMSRTLALPPIQRKLAPAGSLEQRRAACPLLYASTPPK